MRLHKAGFSPLCQSSVAQTPQDQLPAAGHADDGGAKHPSSLASAAAKAAVQAFEALHQAERLQASGDAPAAADTVQAGSKPLSSPLL